MKIAILGGAGRQVFSTIKDLIEEKDVEEVLLGDIDMDALQKRKESLNSKRIRIAEVDINDHNALVKNLVDADVCINGSSHVFNLPVMDACIDSKTHYTDLGGLFHWAKKQLKKHDDFKAAGITGIVGSGTAPGIVNVFSKYAVDRLDSVDTIRIQDLIINEAKDNYKLVPPYALGTILSEFTENNFEFINGEWEELPPFSGLEEVELPEPFGRLTLYNMIHSEVATMPISFKDKGIKNVSFKLSLPRLFEERLRFIIANGLASEEVIDFKGQKICPRDFFVELIEGRSHESGTSQPEKKAAPKDHKWLKVIVSGIKDGINKTIILESVLHPYTPWNMATGPFSVGFPAAVTAKMLGRGQVKEKGFFAGEQVLDTDIYFSELAKRDIHVTCRTEEEIV